MRIYIGLLFVLMSQTLYVNSQEVFTPPIKSNTAFAVGENLTYQIRYGFIVAGTATLTLTEELYKKKTVFHARAIGETTGVADKIYGVRDIYESWFEKESNLPYKQVRDIKEGHYTSYNEVTYNRKNNTVHSKLSGEHPVPEKILDLSSAFYYLRRVDYSKMNEGTVILVNMYFGDQIYPFRLRYRGREMIRTKFGKISCLKISPVVEAGRMFKTQDDLTIWFSDDGNCLPVLVRMDIRLVGSVLLKLVKYENIVNPFMFQE